VQGTLPTDWLVRYGMRFDEFRLLRAPSQRQALAEMIGADGLRVLHTLYTPEDPAHMRLVPAVDVLRRSWIQQYWTDNGPVWWRTEADLPPNARLIVSPTTLAPALERDVDLTATIHRDWQHVIWHPGSSSWTPGIWTLTLS
jgi:transposase